MTRVSVDSAGGEANLRSDAPSISAGGRYVAFQSAATDLVLNDTNNFDDVFVHDRQTGVTTRVSVSSGGVQGNNHSSMSFSSSVSTDGRYVTFSSNASNLVPTDMNGRSDIFVRDRQAGTTTRVSVSSGGSEANNHSFFPTISWDGRYVAFQSSATNLVIGDMNATGDIFVHDRQTAMTTRVSISSAGLEGNGGSGDPSISADGRFVAFASVATNLVSGDGGSVRDIFVRDRLTGVTSRASVDSSGIEGDLDSLDPSISADGRYIAFQSSATNLVPNDMNGFDDVFVHDRVTGTTTRASVSTVGAESLNGESSYPSISSDGRFVAFHSFAPNLVPGDTNGAWDVFVHDRQFTMTWRVSVSSAGLQGNDSSFQPSITANGNVVAFQSLASNFVPDTNGWFDIFVNRGRTRVRNAPIW